MALPRQRGVAELAFRCRHGIALLGWILVSSCCADEAVYCVRFCVPFVCSIVCVYLQKEAVCLPLLWRALWMYNMLDLLPFFTQCTK